MPFGIARICNAAMARKARLHVLPSVKQTTRSLSGLGIVGCESTAAVHLSPTLCPIAGLWGCKSGKNCPRCGRLSLSTSQARQAPRHVVVARCDCACSRIVEAHFIGSAARNLMPRDAAATAQPPSTGRTGLPSIPQDDPFLNIGEMRYSCGGELKIIAAILEKPVNE